MPTLLLASKSPRRRQLLTQLGFPIRFIDINVEEVIPGDTPVELISAALALQKAKGYSQPLANDEILVTADTIVVHRGKVLGKPSNADEAYAMLHDLSGDSHTVFTGVCLKNNLNQTLFTEATTVWFRHLNDDVINHYIEQGTCLDKAGAYGIQEWIGCMGVRNINGSFYNVMGLPLHRLYTELNTMLNEK